MLLQNSHRTHISKPWFNRITLNLTTHNDSARWEKDKGSVSKPWSLGEHFISLSKQKRSLQRSAWVVLHSSQLGKIVQATSTQALLTRTTIWFQEVLPDQKILWLGTPTLFGPAPWSSGMQVDLPDSFRVQFTTVSPLTCWPSPRSLKTFSMYLNRGREYKIWLQSWAETQQAHSLEGTWTHSNMRSLHVVSALIFFNYYYLFFTPSAKRKSQLLYL